jgi:predicted dehydrogenase
MESVLNWVVVGIGDIATKRVIPAILAEPRSRLWGVVSRDPAKAAPYTERVWTSLEEALRDQAVEAVYVAAPVFLHAPLATAALRAGRHVLCEKPMAMNYPQALDMVATGQQAGRVLGVAYYRRMYPKLHRARALLAAGAIGRPVLAEINCHGWFTAQGGARNWLLDPLQAGAGPLYDIASHRVDVLNFLFGNPLAVAAQLSNAVHQTAVEDNATVLIEYPAGVRGIVDVRWHSRVSRDAFRIVGTQGEMDLSPLNGPALVYPGGAEQLPCPANVHYPCVQNFVAAVLDGAPLASSGESSLWTDWVLDQALRTRLSPAAGPR